ncbi:YdeI/OmpD-associated family protein [Glycomyces terrestris]|uniref:YdeI/OmpD-associated family protein n=1 Tax=Glycomyces terrestris TaxID=2493553 RepID=UPI0013151B8B|nr:OmdA domain containing protein [Glycomyces terrestris]
MSAHEFADLAAWEAWLERHHGDRTEAWLRIGKRRTALALIRIEDAIDGALCFGWIDGQRKALDGDSFLQRFSPRRAASPWSLVNRVKADGLVAAGRMRPAGAARIAEARADGRWDAAYEGQRSAAVPPELAAAAAAAGVEEALAALGRGERYALMLPVLQARTAAARERIAARIAAGLAERRGAGPAAPA